MTRSIIPEAAHRVGDEIAGFVVDAVTPLRDIKALAYEAHHRRTGAQVLHVHCHDEENMFSVGFRTPPPDSTGVAHIIEHAVLAGSKTYPVQDAFNELMKRSLATFINAMTWPDRTIYPVCSAVRADYFNLAAVYADLVFHPLMTERTFRQEGHHLELEDLDDRQSPLTISGVVYNEMKGAYSAPESVVFRSIQQDVLPDSVYGVDSGGDPGCIPDLTYEQFVAFQRRYYSPSNARFLLYGDVSLADNLAFIDKVLAPFGHTAVDSSIAPQPRWSEPRRRQISYPVDREDALEAKSFVTLTWMVNETPDAMTSLLLDVAMDALYGTAAGPLRKALIDSGLGMDIFPSGAYDADIRHALVSVGLRGTEADRADEIERLILDALAAAVEAGIPRDLIEASFHQVEFSGKEIRPPFPIMLLMRANPMWYYEADPKIGLEFGALAEAARERWAREPRLFESIVRTWLLDNPHRLRLVCVPSNTMADEDARAESAAMAARKAAMTDDALTAVIDEARALKAAQQTPDAPEAVATLPMLSLADIPRRVRTIPVVERDVDGVTVLEHEVFSNGVGYVGLAFDVSDIGDDLAPWLPLLGHATLGMGAAGLGYEAMATRIAAHTGGVSARPIAGRAVRGHARFERIAVDGKALARNAAALFEILHDLLAAPDPGDAKRLHDLLQEGASSMSARLVHMGSAFAFMRAAAALDATFRRREQWEGVTQLRFLNDLVAAWDAADATARIANLQATVFARSRLLLSVAGDPEVLQAMRPHAEAFVRGLPIGAAARPSTAAVAPMPRASGVIIPAQVNYVGQALDVPAILDPAAPALELMSQVLANDYLYQKLRVQGGAYGGFATYGQHDGLLAMLSYRDPNLVETFGVYDEATAFLASDAMSDAAVDASRIGAIGSFDQVLAPAQALSVARSLRLYGVTEDDRMRYRDGLLTSTAADIRRDALPHLERAMARAGRAALAPRDRLEAANEKLGGALVLFNPSAGQPA